MIVKKIPSKVITLFFLEKNTSGKVFWGTNI